MPNAPSSWRFRHRSVCRVCCFLLAPLMGFIAATLWHGATAHGSGPKVAVSTAVTVTAPAVQQASEPVLSPKELAGMQHAILLIQENARVAGGIAAMAVNGVKHNHTRIESLDTRLEELSREVAALKAEKAQAKARRKASAPKKTADAIPGTPPAARVVKTLPVAAN
jgi:hypothetical protein